MYFYIFQHKFEGSPSPEKILFLPKAPKMNPKLTYNASIIFSWHRITKKFVIVKSRYTEPVSTSVGFLTEKYLGIQTTIDGQFASEAELMLFLLKYEGLTEEKAVSLPII